MPHDEARRLEALDAYDVVGAAAEPAFDDVCRLAATLCATPIAFVNFVAADHQWSLAEQGMGVRRLSLDEAFCPHALLGDDLMVVPDATLDPRFADNPLVTGEAHVRFYAGVVLRSTEGFPLGTVCVLDRQPRTLDATRLEGLRALGRQATHLLGLRRDLRQQEALTARVQAALDDRQRLLFTVAHDIRTPLNVIKMSAGMLAEGVVPRDVLCPAIARATTDLVALVDALLVKERLALQPLALAPLEAPEVLRAVVEQVRPLALAAKVQLEARHSGPVAVVADADRLGQALLNLVTNAVRHSPPDGVVALYSTTTRSPGWWHVEVIDQGPGIPHEARARIFEAFEQVQRRSDGHGLGLAIVRHLVQAHRGTVEVDSAPGSGCRFVVALPLMPPA